MVLQSAFPTATSFARLPLKSPNASDCSPVPARKGLLGLKRPVAIAEQHARGVGPLVCGYQIPLAVAVKVTDSNSLRPRSGVEGPCGLERTIAIAEQHARDTGDGVSGYQVTLPVAVQVFTNDRERAACRAEATAWPETSRRLCSCSRTLEVFTKSAPSVPTPAWTTTSALPKTRVPL